MAPPLKKVAPQWYNFFTSPADHTTKFAQGGATRFSMVCGADSSCYFYCLNSKEHCNSVRHVRYWVICPSAHSWELNRTGASPMSSSPKSGSMAFLRLQCTFYAWCLTSYHYIITGDCPMIRISDFFNQIYTHWAVTGKCFCWLYSEYF